MRLRRRLALLLVLLLSVLFIGCGEGTADTSAGGELSVPSDAVTTSVTTADTTTAVTTTTVSTSDTTAASTTMETATVKTNTVTNTTVTKSTVNTQKTTVTTTTKSATTTVKQEEWEPMKTMKILAIGNSFAEDTFWQTPEIAASMGLKDYTFGALIYGGCSINQHLKFAESGSNSYIYYKNTGTSLVNRGHTSMETALCKEKWDWVILSTGTGDGSRWTEAESYKNLPQLVAFVRQHLPETAQIAFNVTWPGEPAFPQPDLQKYRGNQVAMMNAINEIILSKVVHLEEIATILPTGIAVQNLREMGVKGLSRDGYHLSIPLGRYVAGMVAMMKLTHCNDLDKITYLPAGVAPETDEKIRQAVAAALAMPFAITTVDDANG